MNLLTGGKKYTDMAKVIRVCKSCIEAGHCDTALKYIGRYVTYHEIDRGVLYKIAATLVGYLQDTRQHATQGYHEPWHNGYKIVKTFPDINDYLFDILKQKV